MDGQFWYVYMLQSIEHTDRYYAGMSVLLSSRCVAKLWRKVCGEARLVMPALPAARRTRLAGACRLKPLTSLLAKG